ncbi:hypothetical protein FGO68_gene14802 [Halteria grandinella]|uniref:Uncharacterized protein n=1 Tax=Halteria grandinella TaxID=5974 RepID=A0A8J8NMW4_HALGN|nr:hypothetical protein FGO68_gene14802 [Halteria grandinella]
MDRLNEILKNSREQASSAAKSVSEGINTSKAGEQAQKLISRKEVTKFLTDNKLPRYLIYGIILVKITTIYDKMRQIVAINNVYEQIVKDERESMRARFKDEGMVQDVLTRRILEQKQFVEDEEELERGAKVTPAYRKSIQL